MSSMVDKGLTPKSDLLGCLLRRVLPHEAELLRPLVERSTQADKDLWKLYSLLSS